MLLLNLQVKELATSEDTIGSMSETLDDIITEAKLVKTALGSSLPVSWIAESDDGSINENTDSESGDIHGDSSNEKMDSVSAAGFEMVELLILAAQILKDSTTKENSWSGSCFELPMLGFVNILIPVCLFFGPSWGFEVYHFLYIMLVAWVKWNLPVQVEDFVQR